jgi:hypothetical protein
MKRSRSVPFSVRFDSQIKEDTNGCWLWQGTKGGKGYGQICRDGKTVGAHRASWEMNYGPIPSGLFVCHHCDTPACVNPAHLFLGTNQQNMLDCIKKGRFYFNVQSGVENGKTRLTAQQVRSIIERLATTPVKALAKEYGVSLTCIYDIKERRTWTYLTAA